MSFRQALIRDIEITNEDEHVHMQTVKEMTRDDEGEHGNISVTAAMCDNRLFQYQYFRLY